MCPNCGRAYPASAVWVVNPERYFCTCVSYNKGESGATTGQTDKIVPFGVPSTTFGIMERAKNGVIATRPSEV